MQIPMDASAVHVTWAGVALLLSERVFQLVRYRNGSSRRLSEDRVRLIVQEELTPISTRLNQVADTVSGIAALQNASVFKAKAGK